MDESESLLSSYSTPDIKIPTEKLFAIARFNAFIEQASKEDIIKLAKETYKYMIYREEYTNQLVKHSWGLDNDKVA